MAGLLDFLQGASNASASTVSGPVDMLAWLLQKAGVPVGNAPPGGSAWMEQKGLTKPVKQSAASLAGETVGLLSPTVAAAKAPQIAKGLLQAADNAAAPSLLRNDKGAIVWHGSPHKFDKFDSSKIGTGEGAQAYGHGLYLAESPEVAKSYQTTNVFRAFDVAPEAEKRGLQLSAGARGELIRQATANPDPMIAARRLQYANASTRDIPQEKLADLIKGYQEAQSGALYKVDLPDSAIAKMLDWDKPLSQQAPEVSKALQSVVGDVTSGGFDLSRAPRNVQNAFDSSAIKAAEAELTAKYGATKKAGGWVDKSGRPIPQSSVDAMLAKIGGKGYDNAGQLYNDLTHIAGSQADLSAVLRNNGIPGIRYLDGGSRGAGVGSSNFVVFPGEEGLLKILERNGQGL